MPRTISKIIKFAGEPRRERFNLYLLNHTFPDSSGVTVCEDLRKFDAETPILFYSARAIPQEKEAAIRAGAQDYLIKPNDLFNVAAHAAKWIAAGRGRRPGPLLSLQVSRARCKTGRPQWDQSHHCPARCGG